MRSGNEARSWTNRRAQRMMNNGQTTVLWQIQFIIVVQWQPPSSDFNGNVVPGQNRYVISPFEVTIHLLGESPNICHRQGKYMYTYLYIYIRQHTAITLLIGLVHYMCMSLMPSTCVCRILISCHFLHIRLYHYIQSLV